MRTFLTAIALAAMLGSEPASALGPSCADPDRARAELVTMLSELELVAGWLAPLNPTAAASLDASVLDLEEVLATMGEAEEQALCELLERHPELLSLPDLLTQVVSQGWSATESGGCLYLSREARRTAFIVRVNLENLALLLETTCDSTSCLSFVCVVTCALASVAREAVHVATAVLSEDDYCGKSLHAESVALALSPDEPGSLHSLLLEISSQVKGSALPALDTTVSTRAAEEEVENAGRTLSDGAGELRDATRAVGDDLAAAGAGRLDRQDAWLVERIEANLRPGVVGRVSLLQLPRSAGGLLEDVRDVVARTITMSSAAGLDTTDSLAAFDQADQAFNGGSFKHAFGLYRAAYRAALPRGTSQAVEPADGRLP